MPLISALMEAKAGNLYEFSASLIYRVSSRTARDTQRNHISNPLPQKIQTFLIRYCPIHHMEQISSVGINDKERGDRKWYLSLYYRMDTGSFE